jgi:hypothetical protein
MPTLSAHKNINNTDIVENINSSVDVPSWSMFSIKFFLYVGSNILSDRQIVVDYMTRNRWFGQYLWLQIVHIGDFIPNNESAKKICCILPRFPLQQNQHRGFCLFLTFSILYSDNAFDAISTASCCIESTISAFFITAFLWSLIVSYYFVFISDEVFLKNCCFLILVSE